MRPLGRKLDGWEHPGEHGEYGAARHAVCLGQLAKRDVPPRVLLNQALLLAGQRAKPALLHENYLRCVLCVTLRRPVPTLCISPARVGNADPSVAFGDSSPFRSAIGCAVMPLLKGEVPAMQAVGFISAEFGKSNLCFPNSSPDPAAATCCRPCRPAATGCRLSLPGGQTSEGVWGSAKRSGAPPPPPPPAAGSARPSIRKESCGFADLGRFNIWRPTVVARPGGSNRVQAQPAWRPFPSL